MIALLLDAETLHTVAPLVIAVLMAYALAVLTAAVRRTARDRTRHRHARWWSPPRPHRLLAAGRHSKAGRRRAYAATKARHTTRPAPPAPATTTAPDPGPAPFVARRFA